MPALQSNIQSEINKLDQPAAWVELFSVDATEFGGPLLYFTNYKSKTGGNVTFNSIQYVAIPIQATGFDTTATGTLPKPVLTIGNDGAINPDGSASGYTMLNAIYNFGDLVGAKFTRIRTYDKYLDDGSSPNTAAFIGPEVWLIEQLAQRSNVQMQWGLTTVIDRMSFMAGRQILKDQSQKNLYAPGVARTRAQ